ILINIAELFIFSKVRSLNIFLVFEVNGAVETTKSDLASKSENATYFALYFFLLLLSSCGCYRLLPFQILWLAERLLLQSFPYQKYLLFCYEYLSLLAA